MPGVIVYLILANEVVQGFCQEAGRVGGKGSSLWHDGISREVTFEVALIAQNGLMLDRGSKASEST